MGERSCGLMVSVRLCVRPLCRQFIFTALAPLPHCTALPPLPHYTALPPLPHYTVLAHLPHYSALPPLPHYTALPPILHYTALLPLHHLTALTALHRLITSTGLQRLTATTTLHRLTDPTALHCLTLSPYCPYRITAAYCPTALQQLTVHYYFEYIFTLLCESSFRRLLLQHTPLLHSTTSMKIQVHKSADTKSVSCRSTLLIKLFFAHINIHTFSSYKGLYCVEELSTASTCLIPPLAMSYSKKLMGPLESLARL